MSLLGKFIIDVNNKETHFKKAPVNGYISLPVFIKLTPAAVGLFKSVEGNLLGYQQHHPNGYNLPEDPCQVLSAPYWLNMDFKNTLFEVNGYLCHTNLFINEDIFLSGNHPSPYFSLDFVVEGKEGLEPFDEKQISTAGYVTKPRYFVIDQRSDVINHLIGRNNDL